MLKTLNDGINSNFWNLIYSIKNNCSSISKCLL